MLGGWLHDASASASESVVQLPFARGGTKASLGQQQQGHGEQRHRHDGEGAAFGLDPSSVVEVGGCVGAWVDWLRSFLSIYVIGSTCSLRLPFATTQAHRHATAAEEARRAGRLQESLQEHLEAARCFLEAAERLPDVNGVVRLVVGYGFRQPRLALFLPPADFFDSPPSPPTSQNRPAPRSSSSRTGTRGRPRPSGKSSGGAAPGGTVPARRGSGPSPRPYCSINSNGCSNHRPPRVRRRRRGAAPCTPRRWGPRETRSGRGPRRWTTCWRWRSGCRPSAPSPSSPARAPSCTRPPRTRTMAGVGAAGGTGPGICRRRWGTPFSSLATGACLCSVAWGRGVGVPTSCVTCVVHAHIDVTYQQARHPYNIQQKARGQPRGGLGRHRRRGQRPARLLLPDAPALLRGHQGGRGRAPHGRGGGGGAEGVAARGRGRRQWE